MLSKLTKTRLHLLTASIIAVGFAVVFYHFFLILYSYSIFVIGIDLYSTTGYSENELSLLYRVTGLSSCMLGSIIGLSYFLGTLSRKQNKKYNRHIRLIRNSFLIIPLTTLWVVFDQIGLIYIRTTIHIEKVLDYDFYNLFILLLIVVFLDCWKEIKHIPFIKGYRRFMWMCIHALVIVIGGYLISNTGMKRDIMEEAFIRDTHVYKDVPMIVASDISYYDYKSPNLEVRVVELTKNNYYLEVNYSIIEFDELPSALQAFKSTRREAELPYINIVINAPDDTPMWVIRNVEMTMRNFGLLRRSAVVINSHGETEQIKLYSSRFKKSDLESHSIVPLPPSPYNSNIAGYKDEMEKYGITDSITVRLKTNQSKLRPYDVKYYEDYIYESYASSHILSLQVSENASYYNYLCFTIAHSRTIQRIRNEKLPQGIEYKMYNDPNNSEFYRSHIIRKVIEDYPDNLMIQYYKE